MAFDLNLPIRAVQFVFAIIALGLNGWVANQYDKLYDEIYLDGDAPSEVSFIVFVSVWTMLVTIYLLVAPLKFPRLAPVIAVLALDAVTMLFWFAAFVALAVWRSNWGFHCVGRFCDTVVAGIVFGALEWLLFLVTTALAALAFSRRGASAPAAPTTTV